MAWSLPLRRQVRIRPAQASNCGDYRPYTRSADSGPAQERIGSPQDDMPAEPSQSAAQFLPQALELSGSRRVQGARRSSMHSRAGQRRGDVAAVRAGIFATEPVGHGLDRSDGKHSSGARWHCQEAEESPVAKGAERPQPDPVAEQGHRPSDRFRLGVDSGLGGHFGPLAHPGRRRSELRKRRELAHRDGLASDPRPASTEGGRDLRLRSEPTRRSRPRWRMRQPQPPLQVRASRVHWPTTDPMSRWTAKRPPKTALQVP